MWPHPLPGELNLDDIGGTNTTSEISVFRRGEQFRSQPRVPGLQHEDSNESRDWQQLAEQGTAASIGSFTKQQGLVSTIKASEMLQELSQDSLASGHSQANNLEASLPTRLARLEALLEMMLAKVRGTQVIKHCC